MTTRQPIDIAEELEGRFDDVPPLLRLELDDVVREPLNELRVRVGGGSLGRRVAAEVGTIELGGRTLGVAPRTLEIPLRWRAAEHPMLFPTMKGRLRVRDLGHDTLEVRLVGEYKPPFGVLGALVERFAGRQAASTSLRDYVLEVSRRLSQQLTKHAPPVRRRDVSPSVIERSP